MQQINYSPRLKSFGWILFIISVIVGILYLVDPEILPNWTVSLPTIYTNEFLGNTGFFTMSEANLIPILISLGIIIGGNIVGFSKESVDDEYLNLIRLKGLQYAFIAQSVLFIFILLFVRELALITLLIINFFVMVILFVSITQVLLYQAKRGKYAE